MTASKDGQAKAGTIAPVKLDRAGFVEAFGSCFRGGEILAERAFDSAPDMAIDSESVLSALLAQFRAAADGEKLTMLKVYTPLDPGTRAARIVSDESQSDGLRAMTAAQQRRLLDLLPVYKDKFGFDVIFVVRNYTTSELLAGLEARIADDLKSQLLITYGEVEQLAEIRVKEYFAAAAAKS